MSEYFATVVWTRGEQDFLNKRYSRVHEWQFEGGVTVPASSSPHIVPLPMSVAENVDPEEAFVASISSCHMLFFLDFASRKKWIVEQYTDKAVGTLAKGKSGKLMMTEVVLRPEVTFVGERPSAEALTELHHQSHDACFIANSVLTNVRVDEAFLA
ncbi:OsmC family protein [Marinomonas transparens]|uniref:OsmC family protein n=1 Tax=Marinomonas transparens TaxID=2795388 RepID=A0A934JM61_9GAMM|nr:OsmC family protein [Marinomonas transparens]MBJ7536058.1 OsmC family protein [Marinomonas transparens]